MKGRVRDLVASARAIDLTLTITVAVVAYAVAHHTLSLSYRVAPAIEDLLVACTGRPGWMPDATALYALPQWTAFLERKIEYFPCEAVRGIPLLQVGITWQLQEYFHLVLSTWFRMIGPTVNGFITFQAGSYAVTSALAYLIFRLGLGRIVSLACAAGFLLSASHLGAVGLPIEYSKAPWVLGVVLLCGTILRRDAVGKPLVWAALGLGLVAGLGIGFKPDVIAVAPLALITPLLFVRGSMPKGHSRRIVATLLVVVGLAVGGGRMFYLNFFAPTGSLLPVQVLGGEDWQTESLHALHPQYDYGVTFDDSYVTWMINSYGHRVLGKTAISGFFSREMQEVSSQLVVDLWTTFPGDLVLRVLAAVLNVVQLNGLSVLAAVAGLFLIFVRDVREGWFVSLTLAYLCAYVSLIFQRRHFFHLEFISWWLAGVVAQAVLIWATGMLAAWRTGSVKAAFDEARMHLLKPVARAVGCVLLLAAGTGTLLWAARLHQQATMLRLVERYQQMPRDTKRVTVTPAGGGAVRIRLEGLSLHDRQAGPDVSSSDYLVVGFRCAAAGTVGVKTKYAQPVMDWSNWNRDFALSCSGPDSESTLMVPVYQYATGYVFDGFEVSEADAGRIVSVSTMRADPRVRLWLDLLIPADWRSRTWFETLRMPLPRPT